MHIDEEGILHIKMKKGVHLDMAKTLEYYEASTRMLGDKKALVLVDASEDYTIDEEVKPFLNSEEATRNRIAIAYVTNSTANKLMFNFFASFSKPAIPRKMFSDKENALRWLHTFYIRPGDEFIRKRK